MWSFCWIDNGLLLVHVFESYAIWQWMRKAFLFYFISLWYMWMAGHFYDLLWECKQQKPPAVCLSGGYHLVWQRCVWSGPLPVHKPHTSEVTLHSPFLLDFIDRQAYHDFAQGLAHFLYFGRVMQERWTLKISAMSTLDDLEVLWAVLPGPVFFF